MDGDTSEAIESLRSDIRRVEFTVHDELQSQISALRGELTGEMSGLRDELKGHMGMLVESLRDDIRLLAEGVVSIDAKVESLRRK